MMLSIIIPTTGANKQLLRSSVASVFKGNWASEYELIIIASGKKAPEIASDLSNTCTRVVQLNRIHTFAEAINIGASLSKAELLMLMNDDVVLNPGVIPQMINSMRKNQADILGIKLLYPDGRIQHAGIVFKANQMPIHRLRYEDSHCPEASASEPIDMVTFALVLIKKHVFTSLKGLDEKYRNGFEDVDFTLRAKEKGFKVYYNGTIKAIHYERQTRGINLSEAENIRRFKKTWVDTCRVNKVLGRGESLQPWWMSIAATWHCLSKCQICSIWRKKHSPMLNINSLEKALQNPFYNSITDVSIFGGEPLLHPQIDRLVKFISERFSCKVDLVTSGFVNSLEKKLEKIAKTNTDVRMCISVEGEESYHDRRRGSNSYRMAIKTLKLSKELFKHSPRISFTVLPESVHQINHILELSDHYSADIAIRPAVLGSYFQNFNNHLQYHWNKRDLYNLANYIYWIPHEKWAHPDFVAFMLEFLRSGNHPDCTAHIDTIVVNPDCMASPCHEIEPVCSLEDYPDFWAKSEHWYRIAEGFCFKQSCFIDGPYSVSMLRIKKLTYHDH